MTLSSSSHLKREELRERIFQNHLTYLAHEDNPCKIDKLKALEGLIAEYLAIVPSREKFIIERVGDVLSHAVFNNQEFSAYKAATAFQSIEKYANNLLSQPWRKEYRNIKMYSGFYKHFIESPLPNAHQIFEAMGYSIHNLELELEEPVDPDPVRHVALDCLVAYVECQIMLQICECVRAFECTWTEIHGVRQNYICSVEEATRILQQMKIAQREEANSSNKNQHLLPPLAQPEQIIVTPENTNSIWTDTSPFELPHSSQNVILNLESDLLGRKNDWPNIPVPPSIEPVVASNRRSKIQLDGLTISRSRRSPSWTEGLNSAPVFNFNLQNEERDGGGGRKGNNGGSVPKHNYLHYNWQSEGSDPFEVYSGNFSSQMPQISQSGTKTWTPQSYIPPVTAPSVPIRPMMGQHESWELLDRPIIPTPVYLPIMVPTPVIRAAPLIPAPPAFSSSSSSSQLVNPNPYFDYGHRSSRSLPRKMIEGSNEDHPNQPNYVKLEKDRYVVEDSVDIMGMGFEDPQKPKWKSTASVFRPVEPLGGETSSSSKYYNNQGNTTTTTTLPRFENLSLMDSMVKTKTTTPSNRSSHVGLKVGMPQEVTKCNDNRRFPTSNDDGIKFDNKVIPIKDENLSSGMTKRNSFYDNVPLIDADIGLPSLNSAGGATISPLGDFKNDQTSKNGYRNDSKLCDYNKSATLDKNDYRKVFSSSSTNCVANGEGLGGIVKNEAREEPKPSEPWSCSFCTFINSKSDHICEICGRSKEPAVEISPLASGGKQCPKCTLVNDKDSTNCSACDMSLKDCATYI